MPSTSQLFDRPVDPAIIPALHSLFAESAARFSPITHTMIFMAQLPEMPPAVLQSLGKGNRANFWAGPSTRTGPPFELIFAEKEAWHRYAELAAHVRKQKLPLRRHAEWHLNPWMFTLYQLAWQEDAVSFQAPFKLLRLYPDGSVVLTAPGEPDVAWPLMAQLEQAQGLSGHLVEVYCCQLMDLWAASLEALEVWGKRGAGPSNDQAEGKHAEGAGADNDPADGEQRKGANEKQMAALSPLQYDLLEALRRLKAIDHEKRETGPEIAKKVGGEATDQSVKAPLADLKRRGLVQSRTGRNGGTWLTENGLDFINKLRPKQ